MTTTLSTNQLKDLTQYRLPEYRTLALAIHDHPEVSDCEFYSSAASIKQLEKEGFWAEKEVAEYQTGFDARYISSKPDLTIVFLAGFNALPGTGHAREHNLFGTYLVLAASTMKQFIDEIGGEICMYGTPGGEGSENGSAKGSFAREDFFEDVDAALCIHPAFRHGKTTKSLVNDPVDIGFYSVASHVATAPEKGVNVLGALIQVFNGISALHLQLSKDISVHGVVIDGGVAANAIPDYVTGRFHLHVGNRQTLDKVYEKAENVIQGVVLSTNTTFRFGLLQNVVDDVIVTPSFDDSFFQRTKGAGVPGEKVGMGQRTSLDSPDVGNVSQAIPTIQPIVAIPEIYIAGHTGEFKAVAKSKKGLASIAITVELLANTALDLLRELKLSEKIKREYQEIIAKKEQEGAIF